MLRFTVILLLFAALTIASPVEQQILPQHILDVSHVRTQAGNPRKLRGKFLHITDVHPDPFYRQGTDPDGEHPCHKGGSGRAGYFGAARSECDSPFTLINATFDWIKHNLKDEIDFVVWTGDSARHDNDEKYPRTVKQVEQMNEFVVTKFDEVFGKPDNRQDPDPTNDFVVPIVPTYGNNDFLPHNIFEPGPNKWTRRFLTIWEKFVPQEQRHTFARGGYFFTEVIPNKLAVFSLNTMYFFESNAAVDGCDSKTEPGYEHFEWLRIQLEFLRQRKMKAILMGDVPPARTESKQNWDETCYQKYTLWLRQYRDVVVGNIFGHMNVDHFVVQDVRDLTYKFDIKGIDDEGLRDHGSSISTGFHAAARPDYLNELREGWGHLPSPPRGSSYLSTDIDIEKKKKGKKKKQLKKFMEEIGGPFGERFSFSFISPSIVPNYYPTLRVIEYNITGMEHDHPAIEPTAPAEPLLPVMDVEDDPESQWMKEEDTMQVVADDDEFESAKRKGKKKKGKKPKPNFPVPKPPSKSSLPGPGYSPQPLSFISWTQYYANLTKIEELIAHEMDDEPSIDSAFHEEKMKKHFIYEIEYDTRNDSVYPMKDLTVRSWLDYAQKAGRAKFNPQKHSAQPSAAYIPSDPNAIDTDEEMDDDDSDWIYPDCLAYLRKLKAEALQVHNPWGPDNWPPGFLSKLKQDLMFSQCTSDAEVNLDADVGNDNDSGYESEPEDDSDDDHDEYDSDDEESRDSGYDDDNSDEDVSASRKKKNKHKKKKKGKRKGFSLKKNHLWHAFVRRAFVGSMSYEELKDEFG